MQNVNQALNHNTDSFVYVNYHNIISDLNDMTEITIKNLSLKEHTSNFSSYSSVDSMSSTKSNNNNSNSTYKTYYLQSNDRCDSFDFLKLEINNNVPKSYLLHKKENINNLKLQMYDLFGIYDLLNDLYYNLKTSALFNNYIKKNGQLFQEFCDNLNLNTENSQMSRSSQLGNYTDILTENNIPHYQVIDSLDDIVMVSDNMV